MANFSINGVGFPSPLSAAKSSSQPVQYQPLSSSFTSVSQFPSPYFVQSQKVTAPTVSSHGGSACISSPTYFSMSQNSRSAAEGLTETGLSSTPPFPEFATMWQHSIPSRMPWVDGGTSPNNRDLTQFTASTIAALSSSDSRYSASGYSPTRLMRATRRHKRKSNGYSSSDCPPDKILINEERMAEKMQELQLQGSNKCMFTAQKQQHQDQTEEGEEERWFSTVEEDSMTEEDEETGEQIYVTEGQRSKTGEEPQLQLSEELEQGLKKEDPLTKLIQEQLNKSHMQVVLWKPPGGNISDLVSKVTGEHAKTEQAPASVDALESNSQELKEVRCQGDGMANRCVRRGVADGTASLSAPFCGFHNNPLNKSAKLNHQSCSKNFVKPDLDTLSGQHFTQEPRNVNSTPNPPSLGFNIPTRNPLDSRNGLHSQNGAFSFTAMRPEQSLVSLGGGAFSFTDLEEDAYSVRHLGTAGFNSADPSACSTPREFVTPATGLNAPQMTNSVICDTFDDDMDL